MGLSLPLIVAALVVPQLIERLGYERFGLLALAWGLVGYAGALDLGIGRALTQMIARLRGEGRQFEAPDSLATAARITLYTGLVGGALIVVAALCGTSKWIHTQDVSTAEIRNAMLLLALALPAQAMSATYRGLNEAFLNFKGISVLRVGLGGINFGGPYIVSLYTTNLAWMVATIVVSRLIALYIYRWMAATSLKSLDSEISGSYSPAIARELFSFGGWITISSVVSPILVQVDRFVIASTVSAAAVTIYVVPQQIVVQSLIIVGSISSVMFPVLSALIKAEPDRWRPYFQHWLCIVGAVMSLTCACLAMALPALLQVWLKESLNPESIAVGQVLCLGVFANSVGSMFYALLHAKGRPDVTAKLHIVELPLFIGLLIILLNVYGILGAAWAWVVRMVFDAAALAIFAGKSRA